MNVAQNEIQSSTARSNPDTETYSEVRTETKEAQDGNLARSSLCSN
jgi:hypothetical protein